MKTSTRVAVVEETIAEPKDIEEYKEKYENVILVGSGTYGSVFYIRWEDNSPLALSRWKFENKRKVRGGGLFVPPPIKNTYALYQWGKSTIVHSMMIFKVLIL